MHISIIHQQHNTEPLHSFASHQMISEIQEAANDLSTEVVDVKGAYYKFFNLLNAYIPTPQEISSTISQEGYSFLRKIYDDSLGYEIVPLFLAATAQFLEDEEVVEAWQELYKSIQLGNIDNLPHYFVEFARLSLKAAIEPHRIQPSFAPEHMGLIQEKAVAVLQTLEAVEPNRHYTYLLKEGSYLVYNEEKKALEAGFSPYYSENEKTYQIAVNLFFHEIFPSPNELTHSIWLDICRTQYEEILEQLEKDIAPLKETAEEEELFLFLEEVDQEISQSVSGKEESSALTLLVRIGEFYAHLPELPVLSLEIKEMQDKRMAGIMLIERFKFMTALASDHPDFAYFSIIKKQFVDLAIEFSQYVIKDPCGPLRGSDFGRLARPVSGATSTSSFSFSSRSLSRQSNTFGSSPRKLTATNLTIKRDSQSAYNEEETDDERSTPRVRFRPSTSSSQESFETIYGKKFSFLF